MSSRVAYTLAVMIMTSPLVLVPGLYFYNQHRQHQMEEAVQAHEQIGKARVEAQRLASHNPSS